jgi:hypothetical protein
VIGYVKRRTTSLRKSAPVPTPAPNTRTTEAPLPRSLPVPRPACRVSVSGVSRAGERYVACL